MWYGKVMEAKEGGKSGTFICVLAVGGRGVLGKATQWLDWVR